MQEYKFPFIGKTEQKQNKANILLKQPEQLRRVRNFQQHSQQWEVQMDARKQDTQGLGAAKQAMQRKLTPYEA